jgi:phage host-nuclease inhibitor protein Gam
MKTIFGEEIKAGDEIMYIYKSHGIDTIAFGTVLEVEKFPSERYVRGYYERLHVMKKCDMKSYRDTIKEVNKKAILTNPMAFKCNQMLRNPLEKDKFICPHCKQDQIAPPKTFGCVCGYVGENE